MSTGEGPAGAGGHEAALDPGRALDTVVDLATGAKAEAAVQRSNVTAVPARSSAEAVVALVLADALLEKTGGDSLAEVRRNLDAYLAGLDPHDETGETG